MVAHDDEAGQIAILAAEPVGDPGSDGGAAGELIAGERVINGGTVVIVVDFDSVNEGEVVDARGQVG